MWGFAPYTYLWSNGENTQHADVCPGEHWVEVTDIDGCMVREDFTIENYKHHPLIKFPVAV